MFLASANKNKRLLCVTYIGRVLADDVRRGYDDVKLLLADLPPGFSLLTDLSQVESFDLDSAPEIGRLMEIIDQAKAGLIVRVIPDPDKDIGLSIMSVFHYPNRPRFVTCQTLAEAVRLLPL